MKPAVHLSAGLALLLAASTATAFLGDDGDPMYIEADSVDIDDAKGEGKYRGSVEVKQGGMFIGGAEMTTYQNADKDVDKIITTGSPAVLTQKASGKKSALDAKASRIEMLLERDIVYFIGNGNIKQGNTEFFGERIEYNTKTQAIHADKGKNASGSRVRMVLQPKKKKAAP